MKLEKFKKYGVRNKKILYSIMGITIIIGIFILFKSFAFFESKYDFNVIKGRIPEFNKGDIELAFSINGEKGNTLPNKDGGYAVKSVTCSDGVTAEWNNELWGLFNIDTNGKEKISCNIDFGKSLYNYVNVGDLVSYTPTNTSYTIPKSLTGYSSDQTINPSELNLWRVIKKNDTDGTVEMISEYVSSNDVYFYGVDGYNKFSTTLNTLAKQYETNGITSGSRCINNTTDENLVKTAMPSGVGLKAKRKNTTDFFGYWINKLLYEPCGTPYRCETYYAYYVDVNGNETKDWLLANNDRDNHYPRTERHFGLRIILTFKGNIYLNKIT